MESVVRVVDAFAKRVAENNRGWKTLARTRVIAATGMRHSQVMRLKREDIWLDHEPPVVVINEAGKGGKAHWKPLTAEGVAAFEMFIEKAAFGPFSQSSVYKSWKLACADAGVPFFNPYRLRHTYATTLRAGGMDLADVQQLVGHTSPRTTERYAAVAPGKLIAAKDLLETAISRARENVTAREAERGASATPATLQPAVGSRLKGA
jgi:integrase